METQRPQSSFEPFELADIARRIREKLCVPFLGAAVNPNMLLGGGVARELVTGIQPLLPCDPNNLGQVAWQFELRETRSKLYGRLKELLPDDEHEPSKILCLLAKLPLKLIITTNFDRLLERALNNAGKCKGEDYVVIVQPDSGWDTTDPETVRQFDEWRTFKGLWVYKIHGTFEGAARGPAIQQDRTSVISAEKVPPLTVTEEDYIRFMTAMGNFQPGRIGLPDFIQARIKASTLLFLGYGLQDWNIRTIYNGVVGTMDKNDRLPAFAVQKKPNNLWKGFWSQRKVNVHDCDVQEFSDMLESAYYEPNSPSSEIKTNAAAQ